MKCEWRKIEEVSIEIIDGDRGKNYPSGKDFLDNGYCLFLNTKNVTKDGFLFEEKMFITEEKDNLLRKGKLQPNDVVMTTRGTVGNVAFYNNSIPYKNVRINSGMVIIRANVQEFNPEYVYWMFRSPIIQNQIIQYRSGTAQPQLPISSMKKMQIPVMSLNEQFQVVAVLSSLQKKIELNDKISANLQQQAQAIFKSWFVDFEPFQDGEFVESELGPIPKGWRVGTLSELVAVKYGKDHKKLTDGPYPVYGSGGIMRYVERPIYTKESVLIPRKGTLNNVIYLNEPFWSVDTMFYTEMKMENVAKYVYHFVSGKDLASMNSGSAVPSMTTDILNSMKVVIPTAEWLAKFEQILLPLYSQMFQNAAQSKTLAQLRDTLLPKLMNGGIEATP